MKEANSPIPDQANILAADLWDDSIRCDFEAFKLRVAAALSTATTTGSAPDKHSAGCQCPACNWERSNPEIAAYASPAESAPVALGYIDPVELREIQAGRSAVIGSPGTPDAAPVYLAASVLTKDRLLAALERASRAEAALRALANECDNEMTVGWERRIRTRIDEANALLAASMGGDRK